MAYEVAISGDYAYVANGLNGLQVIDISDPANPTYAGGYYTPWIARAVAISGDHAYVVDEDAGLQVIDISDPAAPAYAGGYDTPGIATDVAISGDYAFVADHDSGLYVVDISDPAVPAYAGSYNTPGEAWGVVVDGDYAFVADGVSGLQVLQVFQRAVVLADSIAQSVDVSPYEDSVLAARLTTAQSDSIMWEMSADGGTNWQAVLPDGSLDQLAYPGTDFRWRSTHTALTPIIRATNPTCTWLQFDFMFEFPQVLTIEDVPNDQGRQVSVTWTRSGHDFVGSSTPIIEYAVYRRIDEDLGNSPESRRATIYDPGTRSVQETREPLSMYPPGDWHFIMAVPADAEEGYAVVAPTLADSTVTEGMYRTTFFVRARTATPGIYFDSPPDSGYSVDNLAPSPPPNFRMTSPIALAWDEAPEPDFNYFSVYGSANAGLDSTATLIGHTIATTMDLPDDIHDYYHVTATDFAGNQGVASSVENVYAGVGHVEDLPEVFALAIRPNPFESSTTIAFDLPKPCAVRLEVVDVQGRVVKILTDEAWPAGRHSVVWTGENDAEEAAGPGVYFVRIQAGEYTARNKILLMK
jgi:hypothetical protein